MSVQRPDASLLEAVDYEILAAEKILLILETVPMSDAQRIRIAEKFNILAQHTFTEHGVDLLDAPIDICMQHPQP